MNRRRIPWLLGFLSLWALVGCGLGTSTSEDLAAQVRSAITEEWQKLPEMQDCVIEDVTLVHKGGNTYTGFLDVSANGEKERISLEVTRDGSSFVWQLKSTAD